MKRSSKYRKEIIMVLLIKLILISLIWGMFFKERPNMDAAGVASHLLQQAGEKP
ncbi:cytochrome oxidase putative small subunit CydP [Chromobacterium sp. ASV23]|uniref:cytochrome oxidase putative small subunit CydP n=1 Tax=Chromobacterium sp. ASV23 TaxID=2795110 RepID=UPI0018EAC87E|nr:cytochrome oxidase putative small subunit CydP [Chromobacterium sp. ASV23]